MMMIIIALIKDHNIFDRSDDNDDQRSQYMIAVMMMMINDHNISDRNLLLHLPTFPIILQLSTSACLPTIVISVVIVISGAVIVILPQSPLASLLSLLSLQAVVMSL